MLLLSRRAGQSIKIGNDIKVIITKIEGGSAYVGIEAPKNVPIMRTELLHRDDKK